MSLLMNDAHTRWRMLRWLASSGSMGSGHLRAMRHSAEAAQERSASVRAPTTQSDISSSLLCPVQVTPTFASSLLGVAYLSWIIWMSCMETWGMIGHLISPRWLE